MNGKEAEIVRLSFDLYLMAVGSTRIASLLDYLGVPTVTGGTGKGRTISGMKSTKETSYCRRVTLWISWQRMQEKFRSTMWRMVTKRL